MSWTISNNDLTTQSLLNNESLFALGNGYLGVRGNFEEGYTKDMTSVRGTYINAFHDITEIEYGEKLYGFPEKQQKLVNIIDAQTIELYFGEDEERFSLFEGEVLNYNRNLHLDQGYSERFIHWKSPNGKELKLTFRRLTSFTLKELFVIDVKIEPVHFTGKVKVVSSLNGDVSNFVDSTDPRLGARHSKRLTVKDVGACSDFTYVLSETYESKLSTACVAQHNMSLTPNDVEIIQKSDQVDSCYTFSLKEPIQFTKWCVFTDTLRHGDELIKKALELQKQATENNFEAWLADQKEYLAKFWSDASITIEGDKRLQEGIRFNLFHLLQSVGRDQYSNISAKGLTGEGYEGHYFWDTEIYMFPVFLLTNPGIAKNLLLYRFSKLEQARDRAREMGHKKGALFPWRTISGTECSGYFPSGSAQYHISADIAYSYISYYLATKDDEFLTRYGLEVLVETARLWLEVGHFDDGVFKIDAVTGPDEYTCIVNNNYYTNVMAKHNLKWVVKVSQYTQKKTPEVWEELCERLRVTNEEIDAWEKAAKQMYLPYDDKLNINPQDDAFLKKAVWDFEHTPKEHYPLLLHYHPLTLYRYQVCKQADTVLAHFLLEDEAEIETIKNSYDYYEKVTTHDSSLSSCIFSMMAAKVGYQEKAYDYFIKTARLDLDNTHGNTRDGLHMANMGGTWMAVVYGFAGFRLKEEGISLSPFIPEKWNAYAFQLQYQGCKLYVEVRKNEVCLTLKTGEELSLQLFGENVVLKQKESFKMDLRR